MSGLSRLYTDVGRGVSEEKAVRSFGFSRSRRHGFRLESISSTLHMALCLESHRNLRLHTWNLLGSIQSVINRSFNSVGISNLKGSIKSSRTKIRFPVWHTSE